MKNFLGFSWVRSSIFVLTDISDIRKFFDRLEQSITIWYRWFYQNRFENISINHLVQNWNRLIDFELFRVTTRGLNVNREPAGFLHIVKLVITASRIKPRHEKRRHSFFTFESDRDCKNSCPDWYFSHWPSESSRFKRLWHRRYFCLLIFSI